MFVYRVEDNSGWGPYNRAMADCCKQTERAKFLNDLYRRHSDYDDREKHPAWCIEGISSNCGKSVAGFSSKRQIKSWFNDKERKALQKYGFFVSRYKVKKSSVQRGTSKRQIAFCRFSRTTKVVSRMEFSELC